MELLKKNYLNTTSSLSVDSNTATAKFIFNPDIRFQYASDGFNNDLTTTSIVISFSETLSVSRIGLVGMNLQSFTVFYNGATINTFALTSTGATSVSDFSSNSETSIYMMATPVNATSVTFDLKSTILPNSEKAIGVLYVGNEHLVFERDPSAKNYKPKVVPKQVIHKMSDGGVRIQQVSEKRSFTVKYKNITPTFRDGLKTLFDLKDEMVFVPFGTTTGWDSLIVPVVWAKTFDFFENSDNAVDAGFSGKLLLNETSVS